MFFGGTFPFDNGKMRVEVNNTFFRKVANFVRDLRGIDQVREYEYVDRPNYFDTMPKEYKYYMIDAIKAEYEKPYIEPPKRGDSSFKDSSFYSEELANLQKKIPLGGISGQPQIL